MAIEKIIALKNIQKVVSDDATDNVHIDMGLADAYEDSVAAAEHVEEVMKDLDNKAEEVITENPDSPEPKVDNIYTKKHTLDESIEDFDASKLKPTKVYDDDEFDTYWDMDMFDFIYELVSITDARRKPVDPLGRPHARFAVTGRDRYAGLTDEQKQIEKEQEKEYGSVERAMLGSPQVAAKDDYIEVYAHNLFRFDDILQICDKYGFRTEGPTETYKTKRNKFMMSSRDEWIQYEYALKIYVPTDENGIFLRIEDYFEPRGLELEDVMNPEFCKHYRKLQKKIQKEQEDMLARHKKDKEKAKALKAKEDAIANNDASVEEIYKKYYDKAAWSNDPIESFIKDMFSELDNSGLKYSKKILKQRFIADFEDDFEDDVAS